MFGPGPSSLDNLINLFFMDRTKLVDKSFYNFFISGWFFALSIVVPCLFFDFIGFSSELSRYSIYLWFTSFFYIMFYLFINYLIIYIGENYLNFPFLLLKFIYISINIKIVLYCIMLIFYFLCMCNGWFFFFYLDYILDLCITFLIICIILLIIFHVKFGFSKLHLLYIFILILFSFILFWCINYSLSVYFCDFVHFVSIWHFPSLGDFDYDHKNSNILEFTLSILPTYHYRMYNLIKIIYIVITSYIDYLFK